MQILKDTPMKAGIMLGVDKDGADVVVLAVKGAFNIPLDGSIPQLAAEQAVLLSSDEYYGDPATTSIKYAYDFALRKPMTDVVLVGSACAPPGTRTRAVRVSMKVGDVIDKTIQVVGDRRWERGLVPGFKPSEPEFFEKMPLIYERAFGGSDTTHSNARRHRFHRENLVGVGLHADADRANVIGKLLPNLEHPDHPMVRWGDTTPTMGFGFISPGWKPRIDYAGTYDEAWDENRFPFLPEDFDDMYFQAAPVDQIVPFLQGGEQVTLKSLSPHGELSFALPTIDLPVTFIYRDGDEEQHQPKLDTLILEPDELRFQMLWRVLAPKVGKLDALREIVVGSMSEKWWRRKRSWKPHYSSLAEYVSSRR